MNNGSKRIMDWILSKKRREYRLDNALEKILDQLMKRINCSIVGSGSIPSALQLIMWGPATSHWRTRKAIWRLNTLSFRSSNVSTAHPMVICVCPRKKYMKNCMTSQSRAGPLKATLISMSLAKCLTIRSCGSILRACSGQLMTPYPSRSKLFSYLGPNSIRMTQSTNHLLMSTSMVNFTRSEKWSKAPNLGNKTRRYYSIRGCTSHPQTQRYSVKSMTSMTLCRTLVVFLASSSERSASFSFQFRNFYLSSMPPRGCTWLALKMWICYINQAIKIYNRSLSNVFLISQIRS